MTTLPLPSQTLARLRSRADREALRRLVCYYAGQDYDSEVVRGVYLWATDNGMTGPLPPLPDHMVNYQPTTEDQP
jgi:hypothetical protein